MNLENLKKAIAHIETVPSDNISMTSFRRNGDNKVECNSVGCIIGHCVILDPKLIKYNSHGHLLFVDWSHDFFGILNFRKCTWDYLFSFEWQEVGDVKKQALIRMNKVLNGYNPETDWNYKFKKQTLD